MSFTDDSLSRGQRRSYAQHWEFDELPSSSSKSRAVMDEDGSVSNTDDDDEDYTQMIRLMESLPCDADL